MQQLLLELMLDIVDHLELPQDKKTLEAISRVCRALLVIARRRLFTSLRVRATDLLRISTGWEEWNGFLKPFHPDLSVVTHLYLQGQHTLSRITSLQLEVILSCLPRVRHITLQGWDVPHFDPNTPAPRIKPFLSLDTLELVQLRSVQNPQGLLGVLYLFGSARVISMDQVEVGKVAHEDPHHLLSADLDCSHRLSPTSLSIRSAASAAQPLLYLFGNPRAAETLRSLEVVFHSIADSLPAVGHLLARARVLETLTFDLSKDLPLDSYGSALLMNVAIHAVTEHLAPAFAASEGLRRFTLHLPGAWRQHRAFWTMCTTLLASLPTGIRHVDIYVRRDSFYFDSEKLDAALAGLDGLESVIIVAESLLSPLQQERIIEALPRIAGRGVVELGVEGGDTS